MSKFFFISTYDLVSKEILSSILNKHNEIECNYTESNPFLSIQEPDLHSIDKFITHHSRSSKRLHGNCGRFASFELQHTIMSERTIQPSRKVTITLSAKTRINCLLYSWLSSTSSPDKVLQKIESNLFLLGNKNHNIFKLYNLEYFYKYVVTAAHKENIDIHSADNKLYLIALATVLAYDSADLPTHSKKFNLEKIISDDRKIIELLNYISFNQLSIDSHFIHDVKLALVANSELINTINSNSLWASWQEDLLNKCLSERLRTVYYPYIDEPLSVSYTKAGYQLESYLADTRTRFTKLISIHLNSNRPAQLAAYFDNIDETVDDPSLIEVLVNIDTGDKEMELLLQQESRNRKFTIKYINSPRPKSFCDLWKPLNQLLTIADPNAYFLLNISDEMLFITNGWDTILKKYVGTFSDHLFRLRASRNKFRNYFDRWECSFAQDSIPITTKKWIDVSGDWNPCFGPDSFQQLIAFYLSKEGAFSNRQYLRELPLLDIQFAGDVASLGIDSKKLRKRFSEQIKGMEICQSYLMQLEARRRAILIRANIIAFDNQLENYDIVSLPLTKKIQLLNRDNKQIIATFDYKVSWLAITFTNQWRKLFFHNYFGDGLTIKSNVVLTFLKYLKMKYLFFYKLHQAVKITIYSAKTISKKIIFKNDRLARLFKIYKRKKLNPTLLESEFYSAEPRTTNE